jgi:hypothetical protein
MAIFFKKTAFQAVFNRFKTADSKYRPFIFEAFPLFNNVPCRHAIDTTRPSAGASVHDKTLFG